MLPAQLHCTHSPASAIARNVGRPSVVRALVGTFAPLQFPIFEANSKFLTGTSCILLKFGVWGCPRLSYSKI